MEGIERAVSSEEWEEWMNWEKTSESKTHARTNISCGTSFDGRCQLSSPEASATSDLLSGTPRKRKRLPDSQKARTSAQKQAVEQTPAQNKSHSIVEKRYRTNINQKIAELGNCLPSLQSEGKSNGHEKKDSRESTTPLKHNKATVLIEAVAYIKHLEQRNGYLEQANTALQKQFGQRVSAEIPLSEDNKPGESVTSEDGSSSPTSCPPGSDDTPPSQPIRGMIGVPEEWKRMWRGELRSYTSSQVTYDAKEIDREATENVKISGGKYARRVVVGSLAGLMMMDGFAGTQEEQSGDRGLFSLPVLRRLPTQPAVTFHLRPQVLWDELKTSYYPPLLLPLLKGFLVFGLLGLMLFIYLFNSRPPSRKGATVSTPRLSLSLVSPLEVRQRAFLTAIQTVWVPRHHVLPEMLALNIETAAYVIRQLLGWHAYSWLTGRSEDEEIARVRAWDIAIDAQLSGGDPEISKSRLVLSLWASGTLPSSPARFMLKALHIRILFWQPSKFSWLTILLHKAARTLAHWQWNKAARLQQKVEASGSQLDAEVLTDHLKALLRQSSDEIMTDAMILRAHNLAWNTSDIDRDSVERAGEDTAMRGPLDGLASWFSSVNLSGALVAALQSDNITIDSSFLHKLDVANHSAPPGSLARARALAGKAVFCCEAEGREYVHQLMQQMEPSPLLCPRLPVGTSPAFLSVLPFTDAANVEACLKCVGLVWKEQQTKGPKNESSCEIGNLCHELEGTFEHLGLLGWTAIYRMVLIACCERKFEPVPSLRASVRRLLEALNDSQVLDAHTRGQLASVLKLSLVYEPIKRRHSVASDDTGYASMSDDNGGRGIG